MKTYGQDVTDLLVFANDLTVNCDHPDLVWISSYIGRTSFLTPKEVEDLIVQLLEWLFANLTGEEK